MKRRDFLRTTLRTGLLATAGASAGLTSISIWPRGQTSIQSVYCDTPAYAVVPVVGDGKWIWTKPPTNQTGYLEPRQFDVSIGLQIQGRGAANGVCGTTAVPVELQEQSIDDVSIESEGCVATLRQVAPEAGQLCLSAPTVQRGQVIGAVVRLRVTLRKQYQGYDQDQFPAEQEFPKGFRKLYVYDSPGIQTRQKLVKDLAAEIAGQIEHPWDQAKAFHQWVWEHIKARRGFYTSVIEAIRDRVGDCEERAAVFVALCRVSGIPARLVWVPNHNWAEFCLRDHDGDLHWIPAHTSAYSWFGWTGAHELVLQKGDSIRVPEKRKPLRLMADWMQWQGARPRARYYGELRPVATNIGDDPGPGGRRKSAKGEWVRTSDHPLNETNQTRE